MPLLYRVRKEGREGRREGGDLSRKSGGEAAIGVNGSGSSPKKRKQKMPLLYRVKRGGGREGGRGGMCEVPQKYGGK